jgi:hexosaminidase
MISMHVKLNLSLAILLSLLALNGCGSASKPAIVPLPQKVEVRTGNFHLNNQTKIAVDSDSDETGRYLAAQLLRQTGQQIQVQPQPSKNEDVKGNILLTTKNAKAGLGPEGYELSVTPDAVTIRAAQPAGLFYGAQSLLQSIPPQPSNAVPAVAKDPLIPCIEIEDQPRFKWRGLMLDVCRHFFTKEEVKQLLDTMVVYKLNTFHWHLTDDQGWRIEIKKYPRLTEAGAWRKGVGFGLDPKSTTSYGPDGRYGGFYTQDDIREVVAYAKARHITIVPEIEMPGHASAALTAYPQLSCTGGPFTPDLPGGIFDGVFCAGNDESFTFLQDVLSEVFELFPGKYIHVGGDEVLTNNWHSCVKCQARLKQEGLKKDIDLESYFIRRMEKFINSRQRTLIGWSEIREGGLAENADIMDWVGGAVEAATAGHDVVMSPLNDCYFDHYQSRDHSTEPHAIGGYLPMEQVYAFEPVPAKLPAQSQWHILGAQGNVWTEYMPNFKHVQYMIFPRLCALAEVVWSPKSSRNWDDFQQRMQSQYPRLDGLGINYRHSAGIISDAKRTQ